MIYVEMNGRLGNQFFRYAFSRWLQQQDKSQQDSLIFDFSIIYREAEKAEMPGWEDSLRHFHVVPYDYYERDGKLLKNETSLSEKAVLFLIFVGDRILKSAPDKIRLSWWKRFLRWEDRNGIYKFFIGYDYPYTLSKKSKKIIAGPYECARYCEEIRPVLLKEFTPRYPVLEKNLTLMEKISSVESVCITVRRGNFLKYPVLNVCNASYYEAAIEKIRNIVLSPVFFVFSDDVEWVRENVKIDGEVFYEDGSDPVWEKLRLMYSCKHFIISNSTFSWWAQFLGQAPDKVVIAPSRWHNEEYQPPLFEKGWITIDL